MISKLTVSSRGLLIIVLAVATTSLLMIKLIKNNEKCSYQDKIICKFFSKSKNHFQNDFSAILISQADDKEIKEIWRKQDNVQELLQYSDKKEIFDILFTEKELYVKDITDNHWWKQTVPQKNSIEKQLPEHLNIAQKIQTQWQQFYLIAQKLNYKQIGKEPCLEEVCYKYQIIRSEVSDMTELLFINPDFSLHKVRHEYPDGTTKELLYEKIKDYPKAPEKIKTTVPSQNIFAHIQPIREEKKDLDYLKDFENNMNEGGTEEIQLKPSESITPKINVKSE